MSNKKLPKVNNSQGPPTVKSKQSSKLSFSKSDVIRDEEYETCRHLIRTKLNECGWSEQVKTLCRKTMKEKGSKVTVDELLEEVAFKAKNMLPTSIKRELIEKVKEEMRSNVPPKPAKM